MIQFQMISLNSTDDLLPIVVKKDARCLTRSRLNSFLERAIFILVLFGLEFLEPHRFTIRTISNIVRHIFILNL